MGAGKHEQNASKHPVRHFSMLSVFVSALCLFFLLNITVLGFIGIPSRLLAVVTETESISSSNLRSNATSRPP